MALTATATPAVENDIKKLLRNPLVLRASINRPNITLSAQEVIMAPAGTPKKYCHIFADHVAEISQSEPTIVYTDFIADIGPIVSALSDLGIDAVGYYGEMDPRERNQSYLKWKTGEVNIMVATKAFGMGIDKSNIRHIIRNGVPESIVSWAQELGRAGRDGCPSTATILYQKSDINHANAWIKNNLMERTRCNRILSDFSDSWRFTEAHLAGCCRRKLLLELFGESYEQIQTDFVCCDVCSSAENHPLVSFNEELKILDDAMQQVGIKGEVKLAEWIRGSSAAWTQDYNKKSFSYGNNKGHSLEQWRLFMRQCNVLGIVKYDLRSLIKNNGHYSVMGIYHSLDGCKLYASREKSLMLTTFKSSIKKISRRSPNTSVSESCSSKRKRLGKGCNILPIVRKMLVDKENWKMIIEKRDYQFLGTFSKPTEQHLYYIPNWKSLNQATSSNPHFLWNDIQLSKGNLNQDREIEVEVGEEKLKVCYRSTACIGVKTCPDRNCDYVVPIRERRNCKKHPEFKLQRSDLKCPVEFVYIYPVDRSDHRRWIGGIVRNQKEISSNLHNHPLHGSFKICNLVKDKINDAIQANPSLTPTDVSLGTGVGFVPSAIDSASSHLGRVAREVAKKKNMLGLRDKSWSPCNLEDATVAIDEEDHEKAHDTNQNDKYSKYGHPYLVSAGVESGIKYSFIMSPLMAQLLSQTQFLQTDITYNDNTDLYPYLFNAVAFNDITMDWMVVCRVWLNTQSNLGYKLAFEKMFAYCKNIFPNFDVNETLKAIVLDWSDAQVSGLKAAIGEAEATALIKGCKVHWLRSCQRVANKVSSKAEEKEIFLKVAQQIQSQWLISSLVLKHSVVFALLFNF